MRFVLVCAAGRGLVCNSFRGASLHLIQAALHGGLADRQLLEVRNLGLCVRWGCRCGIHVGRRVGPGLGVCSNSHALA